MCRVIDNSELHMIKRMIDEDEFSGIANCPDCSGMSFDDQYCCTTCWGTGGDCHRYVSNIVSDMYDEIKRLKEKCGEK